MTSTMEGEPKPVAGYPAGYPPPHPGYQSTGYPSAQPGYSTTAGTAYPYAAPPQTAYYHPNPYPAQSYEYRRSTLFRRLIVAMFAVFLILGAITFILWLVIRPHLPEFQVDSASVSHFNISDSQVTGDWDFAFTVRNPNKKMSIFYDSIKAGVFYRRDSLSETSVVPFYQGTKNLTSVRATFAAASTYVDLGIAKSIAGDRARGAVKFNVKLLAWVRFRSGVWRTRRRLMGVYCTDVNVAFPSNGVSGSLSGGSKECDVEL